MIDMENTYFDASNDGVIPIVPGQYPAHVCGFEGREVQTKIGTQKVFNVEFKIADAVNKMEIIKHQYVEDKLVPMMEDGKAVKVSASFMNAKQFKSTGIWLTENPAEGEGWRNRNYVNFFQGIGVVFPKVNDKVKLAEVEETDILGLPVFVKLDKEYYQKDGEERSTWKVFSATAWLDGEKISQDEVKEDVPF
tara:strand:- start:556 stop:1134 length:579 start_codon:yes stop_codon:yes gene_type:complete